MSRDKIFSLFFTTVGGKELKSYNTYNRLECGSGNATLDRKTTSLMGSNPTQPIVPKLKLSALPMDSKRDLARDKWMGGVSKDPLSLGDSYKTLKVNSEAAKKLNFDEKTTGAASAEASESADKTGRKVELVPGNYAGKIRIKYGGIPSSTDDPSKPEVVEKDHPPTEDRFPFTFSGRPTYSPSRVEPNGNVPTKGKLVI